MLPTDVMPWDIIHPLVDAPHNLRLFDRPRYEQSICFPDALDGLTLITSYLHVFAHELVLVRGLHRHFAPVLSLMLDGAIRHAVALGAAPKTGGNTTPRKIALDKIVGMVVRLLFGR